MDASFDYPGELTLTIGNKKTILWIHHHEDYCFWVHVVEQLKTLTYLYGMFRGPIAWSEPVEPFHSQLLIAQYHAFASCHIAQNMHSTIVDENGGQVNALKMVCSKHMKPPEITVEYQSILGAYGLIANQIYILTGVSGHGVQYTIIDSIDMERIHTVHIEMPLDHIQLFLHREVSPISLSPTWCAQWIQKNDTLDEIEVYT